eukprot:4007860-Pleurochrysis_carterae.AAC.1
MLAVLAVSEKASLQTHFALRSLFDKSSDMTKPSQATPHDVCLASRSVSPCLGCDSAWQYAHLILSVLALLVALLLVVLLRMVRAPSPSVDCPCRLRSPFA